LPRALFKEKVFQRRLPDWFRRDLAVGHEAASTERLLKELGLHTICESGRCPNRDECYSQKTATFMILGDVCTRSCRFCSVSTGKPLPVDRDEPLRVAQAVRRLELQHVVVTSVNRDDLEDEGAQQFVQVILEIKRISDNIIVEILTPDFRRTRASTVPDIAAAGPEIFSHNMETVPRLYRQVRPQADYAQSLKIFREIKKASDFILTKSGLMLGLGETDEEVLEVLGDLRDAGCQGLTLGQYLQSSALGLPVQRFVRPEVFSELKKKARAMGFEWVESGPFVRSSFHAKESFEFLNKEFLCKKPTV
jgi:lipoyl synthase